MDKENLEPQRPLDNDEEKTQVRDFLERLVATMLGETVDDACISKMYHDERCKWERTKLKNSVDRFPRFFNKTLTKASA